MAAVLAMLKQQQEQNKLLMARIMAQTPATAQNHVDLVDPKPEAAEPADDNRRRSPRLRAQKRSPRARGKKRSRDGTPLKRELSFDEALSGSSNGKRRRKSKSPKIKSLRKTLSHKLLVYQDDVMDGGNLWDEDKGGLALGFVFVCLLVCFCLFVCLFAFLSFTQPFFFTCLFFFYCLFAGNSTTSAIH